MLREGAAVATERPGPETVAPQRAPARELATGKRAEVLSFQWMARGGLAVLDQGLFAGTHFVTGVLLARWMSDVQYGAFSVAYALLLLTGTVHAALLTDPLLVLAPRRGGDAGRRYQGALMWGHLGLTLPASLLFLALAGIPARVGWLPERETLLALAIASPLVLLPWLARRCHYAESRPGAAAAGGALYLVLCLCLLVGMHECGWLSPGTALLAMGLSGALAGTALLLGTGAVRPLQPGSHEMRLAAREHWTFGRWLLASLPLAWLSGHSYYLVLPASWGLAASGRLQALMNLALPALHAFSALGALAVPLLVRGAQRDGERGLRRSGWGLAAALVSAAVVYLGVVLGFQEELLRVLYAGRYADVSLGEVILVGSLPIAASLGAVLGAILRARHRTRGVFAATLASALVTLVVGLPLAARMGPVGALAGLLASSLVSVAVLTATFRASFGGKGARSCS